MRKRENGKFRRGWFFTPVLLALLYGLLPRPQPPGSRPPPVAPVAPVDFLAPRDSAAAQCPEAYRSLLDGPVVDIRIVFGYKDARPARFVGDGYERAMLAAYLVAPCREHDTACGFERDVGDGDLFKKQLAGPSGAPIDVQLRLVSSSAGPDDDENRTDPFQQYRSEHAEAMFADGLQSPAIVFYNGHSRDGGGPDFRPPRLAKNQHVDYAWYARERPGIVALEKTLKDSTARVRLLGLFSCASSGHFLTRLHRARPAMATLTQTRILYYADALRTMRGALAAILGQWCPPDFDTAVEAEPRGGATHIVRLFEKR